MEKNKNMTQSDFDYTVTSKKKSKRKNTVLAVFFVLVLLIIGMYFCASNLFFIEKLVIDDDTDDDDFPGRFQYTSEQILDGLGLKKGEGLYTFDEKAALEDAKYNLPYIKKIRLARRPFSTLVAKTELESPEYYTLVDNNLYIISDTLRVLEKTNASQKIELFSLIYLDCRQIHSCIVGEKLGVPLDIEKVIYDIQEQLDENDVENEITSIDISDKFNIYMTYGTRYEVKLGNSKNLGTKIEFMKRIIEDRAGDFVGGTIDVSDEKNREAVYKKFS